MTIWISSQGAHVARDHFAALLELPSTDVRVVVGDVGGGFGLKISVGREEGAVALAARLVGQSDQVDRGSLGEPGVGATRSRRRGEVTLGLDDDGHFLAIKADHLENIGAYGMIAASDFSIRLIAGPYRVGHSHGRNRRVRTNTSRRVAYRGPWLFETLGREVVIDIAARRLGIDPLEMRRRNVLQAGDLPYQMSGGHTVDRVTPAETLEQVASMVGYEEFRSEQARQRQAGRYLGLGLSLYVEPSAMGAGIGATEAATIRIDQSGHVQLITGVNSQGHSVETTMVQVIADQIGVSMEDVTVVRGDTDAVPVGATTGGSRNAVFGGGAALKAGAEMRDRIVRIAAELLEAAPEDLELAERRASVRGTPTRSVGLKEIAATAYLEPRRLPDGVPPGLEVAARFATGGGVTWSNAAHACVCEVDTGTGRVQILRYLVSEDCGTVINPKVVEGQICGGVAQGIGGVLLEHFVYDPDGNPLTTSFMDYLLPSAPEVPRIEYGHIETPSQRTGGWKGMGEGGAIGSPAAVINAVADALSPFGVELTTLPLTPAVLARAVASAAARRHEAHGIRLRATVLAGRGSRPPRRRSGRTPKCWREGRASSRSWRYGWPDPLS